MSGVVKYKDSKEQIMAILIPSNYKSKGIDFITDDNSFFQAAVMSHEKGHDIINHYHNKIERTIDITSECLVMRSGILSVRLYEKMELKYSFEITAGDILILLSGGHGFTAKTDIDMIEIKQGPFAGANDKTRF